MLSDIVGYRLDKKNNMEEEEKIQQDINQGETFEQASKPTAEPAVSRRDRKSHPKANKKVLVIIIVIILIVVAAVFLLREPNIQVEPISEPTPTTQQEVSPTTTPSTAPVNKEEISIQVLNATGIAGQAAYLQAQLEELGYSEIDVGNSDEDTETTTATFASSVSEQVKSEISDRLKSLYKEVDVKQGSVSGYDIRIVAGLRKGQVLPTNTPVPTKSPITPTPTATSSATPTP